MTKIKKIIIWVIVFIVLAGIITYTALVKIGEYMLDSLIDSEFEAILDQGIEVPDTNMPLEADISEEKTYPPESTVVPLQTQLPSVVDKPAPEPTSTSTSLSTPTPTPGAKTSSVHEEPSVKETPKTSATISVQAVEEIKNSVTAQDKAKAATLILGNLTSSDISLLQGLLSGGLTEEEKAKAKEIAYMRFSQEDILVIKELYYKYMDSVTNVDNLK